MTNTNEFSISSFLNTILIIGAFLTPFSTLRITSKLNISLADTCLIVAGIIIGIDQLIIRRNLKLRLNNKYSYYWYLSGTLILIGLAISDTFSTSPKISDIVAEYTQYAFVYFYLAWLVSSLQKTIVAKLLLSLILGYTAAAAISSSLFLWNPGTYMLLRNIGFFVLSVRLSPFMNPNTFAKNMALIIPILILLGRKLGLGIILKTIIIIILMISTFLTASIGGLATLSITFALVLIYSLLHSRRYLISLFVFLLVALLLLSGLLSSLLSITLELPFMEVFNRRVFPAIISGNIYEAGSFSQKTWLMSEGIRLISENPIIGVGTRQFMDIVSENVTMHNTYLLLWVEGGMLSFIGFAVLLILMFVKSISLYSVSSDVSNIAMIIVVIGFAISSYTNNAAYDRSSLLVVLLLFVLSSSSTDKRIIQ